jgi:hypothetical protein
MNIWALDKDNSIKHLLLLLEQDAGDDAFILCDAEQLHPKSIRLGTHESPATAYLYTYGQSPDQYGLHLEYPYNKELNSSEQEEMYEDLSYDAVLEILTVHFDWQRGTKLKNQDAKS